MRKSLLFLFILFGVAKAQITNPAPFCLSSFTSTSSYPEISKVEMAAWPNSLANTSTHTPAPGYTYYNNIGGIYINQQSQYVIKVTGKNVDAETMLKGWIDYNKNNVFENSELILSVPQGSVGTGMNVVNQATFVVPSSSQGGIIRMRISFGWHYANWGSMIFKLDSCHTAIGGDGSAGETEDYDVQISGPSGIKENVSFDPMIFPNPAKDLVRIELNNIDAEIKIHDALGNEIPLKERWNKKELDLSGLQNGIYFLEVKEKNSYSHFYRIIKE